MDTFIHRDRGEMKAKLGKESNRLEYLEIYVLIASYLSACPERGFWYLMTSNTESMSIGKDPSQQLFLIEQALRDFCWEMSVHGFRAWGLHDSSTRSRLRPVEWTCECGQQLKWNKPNTSSEEAMQLAGYLDRANSSSSSSNDRSHGDIGLVSLASQTTSPLGTQSTRSSSPANGDAHLAVVDGATADEEGRLPHATYLEICIKTGMFRTDLCELNITSIQTDGEIFKEVFDAYVRLKNKDSPAQHKRRLQYYSWMQSIPFQWSPMKPRSKEFRKFQLDQGTAVGLTKRELPPSAEINTKRYGYSPYPLDIDEVIPDHVLLHFFHTPHHLHYNSKWTPRLPKKLTNSIFDSTDQVPEGWGIHIVESPDMHVICLAVCAGLVFSGAIAIPYAITTKDVQGAFGVGAYVVTVMMAWMSAMFFKWSQQ